MAQLNPKFASALVLLLSALHGLATAQGGPVRLHGGAARPRVGAGGVQ